MTFGTLFIVQINSLAAVRAKFLDFMFSLFHVTRAESTAACPVQKGIKLGKQRLLIFCI
jgi:hypothetical protein